MAQSEHHEASRAAGERGLFPAIRARPGAALAVMGTSCRQQVEHFTGRPAPRPASSLFPRPPRDRSRYDRQHRPGRHDGGLAPIEEEGRA
jgi:hypothetical protein